jgi:hypothetical protein
VVSARLGSFSSKELGRVTLPVGGSAPIIIYSTDGRARAERRGGINTVGHVYEPSKENSTFLNLGSVTKRRAAVDGEGG